MFNKKVIKKSVIVLVALLLCALVVFTACNPSTAFKPVEYTNGQQVDGNGGIAVRYGEYIYYVNGYQNSATSKNNYSSEVRIGAVARIKIADLEDIIRINTRDSDKISTEIAEAVAEKAQLVVPNFYYNGNTTDTSLNGLFIFNDRIYITTPNDQLDANGNLLSSQLVLTSYNLGGGDVQRHFVFESNAPQLKLSKIGNDLYATYVLSTTLATFKVTDKMATATEIATEISSPKFTSEVDENGDVVADYVYYLDKDGNICQYKVGEDEANVIVELEVDEEHKGHSDAASYTISSVNGARLYYTYSKDTSLHMATAENPDTVVLYTVPSAYYGWGDGIVYTRNEQIDGETTLYHVIYVSSADGNTQKELIDPAQNGTSITLNKLVGNKLYYTTNSISYVLDLSAASTTADGSYVKATSYAYSLSTSATGWAIPDVLSFDWNNGGSSVKISYVFTVSSSGVTVVKFNPTRENNIIEGTKDKSSSTTITLK